MSRVVRRQPQPQRVATGGVPAWLSQAARTAHLHSIHRRLRATPSVSARNPWLADYRRSHQKEAERANKEVEQLRQELEQYGKELERLKSGLEKSRAADDSSNTERITALETQLEAEKQAADLSRRQLEEAQDYIEDELGLTFTELADKNTDLLEEVREKRTLLSQEADLLERLLAAESGGGPTVSFDGVKREVSAEL